MRNDLMLIQTAARSDRETAESQGYVVKSHEVREASNPHLVRHYRPVYIVHYYVDPAQRAGLIVASEGEAWRLAAIEAKGRADSWGAGCRSRRVSVVTDDFVPLADRPLFGEAPTEFESGNPRDAASRSMEAHSEVRDEVARSRRLSKVKLQSEIAAKALPNGREANRDLIRQLVGVPKNPDEANS